MARTFDLILSEYPGYTDETLLDLTMDRIRQMVEIIIDRRQRETLQQQRWELSVTEVGAKIVGMTVSGVAQSKKGAKAIQSALGKINLVKEFDKMQETPEEKKDRVPTISRVMSAFGVGSGGEAGRRG